MRNRRRTRNRCQTSQGRKGPESQGLSRRPSVINFLIQSKRAQVLDSTSMFTRKFVVVSISILYMQSGQLCVSQSFLAVMKIILFNYREEYRAEWFDIEKNTGFVSNKSVK